MTIESKKMFKINSLYIHKSFDFAPIVLRSSGFSVLSVSSKSCSLNNRLKTLKTIKNLTKLSDDKLEGEISIICASISVEEGIEIAISLLSYINAFILPHAQVFTQNARISDQLIERIVEYSRKLQNKD